MPTMEDPGFEVPPAPWEYDDGSNDGSDNNNSQGAGYAEMRDQYNEAGIGAGGSGDSGSDDTGGYDQGAGYAEMRDQYNDAGIGAGGSAAGDNDRAQGYAEMRNQYNAAGIGVGGSAPDDSTQGQGWNTMRDQYNAAGIGAGGSAPSNISQGEGRNLMREQYNAAGIGAGGTPPRDISQGEGWKIMRDQYNQAGLGAGGTAAQPQNRWEAATPPNLLAWGAGYGNAMGQTPQQMADWANQSIQQWNSAHPDDQYPLVQPVVGPKMPAQPPDKKLTQTDVPWYDPKSGRWIQPGSVTPEVNSPVSPTNPSGRGIAEDLWANLQQLWRTLTDPRYARSQAFGGYVDPSGGQWANRDRWPTSPGDLLEGLNRSTTQTDRPNFGPPLNPETIEAIERVNRLGAWVAKNEGMSERAETYQAYVAGTTGEVFTYNDYDFDGFNGNALLDAKDHYKQFIDPSTGDWMWWFSGAEGMVDDAREQVAAAQGAPIEWHFNEKGPADRVRKLFSDEGIEGIEVIYDPMPANWGK